MASAPVAVAALPDSAFNFDHDFSFTPHKIHSEFPRRQKNHLAVRAWNTRTMVDLPGQPIFEFGSDGRIRILFFSGGGDGFLKWCHSAILSRRRRFHLFENVPTFRRPFNGPDINQVRVFVHGDATRDDSEDANSFFRFGVDLGVNDGFAQPRPEGQNRGPFRHFNAGGVGAV